MTIEVVFRKVRDTRHYSRFEADSASGEVRFGALYIDKAWAEGTDEVTVIVSKDGGSAKPVNRRRRA